MGSLMAWRAKVIESVFGTVPGEELLTENRRYYARHVADGSHVAVVAAVDGEDAGCGAVCLYDELPSPENPNGRCGYIMNVYVRPQWRKRGIGTAITQRLVAIARNSGCGKVYLEATALGAPLYRDCGFRPMDGMMQLANQIKP